MNWYRTITAAVLPIERMKESIKGTFENLIPNVDHVVVEGYPREQYFGDLKRYDLPCMIHMSGFSYPDIKYLVECHIYYMENVSMFDSSGPTDDMKYYVAINFNIDQVRRDLRDQPAALRKVEQLIEKTPWHLKNTQNGYMMLDHLKPDSIYEAAQLIVERIQDFENGINGFDGGDGGDGGDDTDPWFPGDPSADWEFEQEELEPVRVRVPAQQPQQQQMPY